MTDYTKVYSYITLSNIRSLSPVSHKNIKSMPKNFKTTSIKTDYLHYKKRSTKFFPDKEQRIMLERAGRLC